jgi:hypothetical protein
MGRIINSVIDRTLTGVDQLQMDLQYGGQDGHTSAIGYKAPDGRMYQEWVTNTPYVQRDIIPIVMTTPLFFDLMPNGQRWKQQFIALMELHAKSIDGLDQSLTLDTDDGTYVGRHEKQEVITRVGRNQSKPKFTFTDKMGAEVGNFWNDYIRYGIEDEEVGLPLSSRLLGAGEREMWTPDWYTFTMLFIEPDVTHREVIHAYLVSNMQPISAPTITGKRDIQGGREIVEHEIEFSGITEVRGGIIELGTAVLKTIGTLNLNPDNIAPSVNSFGAARLDSEFNYSTDNRGSVAH